MHLNSLALISLSVLAAVDAATAALYQFHGTPGNNFDPRSRLALAAHPDAVGDEQLRTKAESQPKRLLSLPSYWLTDEALHMMRPKNAPSRVSDIASAYAPRGELTKSGWEILLRDYPMLRTDTITYDTLAGNGGTVTVEILQAFIKYMAMTEGGKRTIFRYNMPSYSKHYSDCERKLLTFGSSGPITWERFRSVAVPQLIFSTYSNGDSGMSYGDAWNNAIDNLSAFLGIRISTDSTYKLLKGFISGVSRDKFVSFAMFKQVAGDSDCITANRWAAMFRAMSIFEDIAGTDNCVSFTEWHARVLAQK